MTLFTRTGVLSPEVNCTDFTALASPVFQKTSAGAMVIGSSIHTCRLSSVGSGWSSVMTVMILRFGPLRSPKVKRTEISPLSPGA